MSRHADTTVKNMNGQQIDFLDITIEAPGDNETLGSSSRFTIALTQANGSVDPFCGPCVIVDLSPLSQSDQAVTAQQFKSAFDEAIDRIKLWSENVTHKPIPEFKRVLVKTKTEDFLHAARLDWAACLQTVKEMGAVMIGFDSGLNETMVSKLAAHRLNALVNLNLAGVSGGTTGVLVSGPQKIDGELMVPCRAVLIYA